MGCGTAARCLRLRSYGVSPEAKFHRGVISDAGREALPLGDRLFALPVEALWRLGARPNAPSLVG